METLTEMGYRVMTQTMRTDSIIAALQDAAAAAAAAADCDGYPSSPASEATRPGLTTAEPPSSTGKIGSADTVPQLFNREAQRKILSTCATARPVTIIAESQNTARVEVAAKQTDSHPSHACTVAGPVITRVETQGAAEAGAAAVQNHSHPSSPARTVAGPKSAIAESQEIVVAAAATNNGHPPSPARTVANPVISIAKSPRSKRSCCLGRLLPSAP